MPDYLVDAGEWIRVEFRLVRPKRPGDFKTTASGARGVECGKVVFVSVFEHRVERAAYVVRAVLVFKIEMLICPLLGDAGMCDQAISRYASHSSPEFIKDILDFVEETNVCSRTGDTPQIAHVVVSKDEVDLDAAFALASYPI